MCMTVTIYIQFGNISGRTASQTLGDPRPVPESAPCRTPQPPALDVTQTAAPLCRPRAMGRPVEKVAAALLGLQKFAKKAGSCGGVQSCCRNGGDRVNDNSVAALHGVAPEPLYRAISRLFTRLSAGVYILHDCVCQDFQRRS